MSKKIGTLRGSERERFWRKLVAGQPSSGMSVAAWCGEHGVSAPSFYVWRQRLAKGHAAQKVRRLPLLPVEIIPPGLSELGVALDIELPGHVRVRVRPGCELELLRQVLNILAPQRPEAERC